jgi:hypothetical protein
LVVVNEDWATGVVLPAAITTGDAKERGRRGEGLRLLALVGPLHSCVALAMRDGTGPPPAYLGGSAMARARSTMAGDLARGWGAAKAGRKTRSSLARSARGWLGSARLGSL